MACYNFFERLKQLFNNKRCRRAIIIFLLFLLFFCIGKCSSYASSEVDYSSTISGVYVASSGLVTVRDNYSLYLYDLSYGHSYTLINNSGGSRSIAFSNSDTIEVGDVLVGYHQVAKGSEYTFTVNDNIKLFVLSSSYTPANLHLYDNGLSGVDMSTSLNKLIVNTDFWSPFKDSIPFVGVVVFIAFGFMFITFLIRRVKR